MNQVPQKLTSSIAFFKSLQSGLPMNPKNRVKGGVPVPDSHLFWGVWGAWMTFKKPEMDKTLRNGLSMSETDPLNQKWLDFAI